MKKSRQYPQQYSARRLWAAKLFQSPYLGATSEAGKPELRECHEKAPNLRSEASEEKSDTEG